MRGIDIKRGAIAALGVVEAAVTMRRVGAFKQGFHDGEGKSCKANVAFSHTRRLPPID